MSEKISKLHEAEMLIRTAFGFRDRGYPPYPCHWCGIITRLTDAEDFHACEKCQREAMRLNHNEMCAKYPNAGKDERNPLFFAEQEKFYRARAKRATKAEIDLMEQRGAGCEEDLAKKFRDGTLTNDDLWGLGSSLEQYIDQWGKW